MTLNKLSFERHLRLIGIRVFCTQFPKLCNLKTPTVIYSFDNLRLPMTYWGGGAIKLRLLQLTTTIRSLTPPPPSPTHHLPLRPLETTASNLESDWTQEVLRFCPLVRIGSQVVKFGYWKVHVY